MDFFLLLSLWSESGLNAKWNFVISQCDNNNNNNKNVSQVTTVSASFCFYYTDATKLMQAIKIPSKRILSSDKNEEITIKLCKQIVVSMRIYRDYLSCVWCTMTSVRNKMVMKVLQNVFVCNCTRVPYWWVVCTSLNLEFDIKQWFNFHKIIHVSAIAKCQNNIPFVLRQICGRR